jgi:hypothetical protein
MAQSDGWEGSSERGWLSGWVSQMKLSNGLLPGAILMGGRRPSWYLEPRRERKRKKGDERAILYLKGSIARSRRRSGLLEVR